MRKLIKINTALLFMFFSFSSIANEIIIFDGAQEIRLKQDYQVTTCDNIGLADCPNYLDTPNYYFNIETKQLISSCSGACWHPKGKQKEICKTLRPPPKWGCSNDS